VPSVRRNQDHIGRTGQDDRGLGSPHRQTTRTCPLFDRTDAHHSPCSHRLLHVVVVSYFLFITWQTTLQSHTDSLCDLHFDDCKLVTGSRDKTVKGTMAPPTWRCAFRPTPLTTTFFSFTFFFFATVWDFS
jgi:hypothetical protein